MRALIIGISGQDGFFLKKILVNNGYEVFGVVRPLAQLNVNWQTDIINSLTIKGFKNVLEIDLSDSKLCNEYLNLVKPDRIFHLAAVHAPATEMLLLEKSKSQEMYRCHFTLTKNLLDWVKLHTKSRLAVALTSQFYRPHLFRHKITEKNVYKPQNLYARTKLEGFNLLKKYREEYGLFASGLILFNHTSAMAKTKFLFGDLAQQIVEFKNHKRNSITIQNALQKIDICDASEVCEAIYRSIEHDFPSDYVISSGKVHSIESIIISAAQLLNIGITKKNIYSMHKKRNFTYIYGDQTKTYKLLNWKAQKSPAQILEDMVNILISNQSTYNN